MKNKLKYIINILLLLILLGFTIYAYIDIHYSKKGSIINNSSYYDIKFTNVVVNNEELIVKVNDNNDSLSIQIPNLSKGKRYSFSVDLKNIGNEDINIKNVLYNNINTNVEESNVLIETSLLESEIIKGGEEKKLDVFVNYNGNDLVENKYYNFDINYYFIK